MNKNVTVLLFVVLAAGCSSTPSSGDGSPPPMDPTRKVSEQDCSGAFDTGGGNLKCRDAEADRKAKAAEDERQAKARKEAAERAERERLERERAAQLALAESARNAKAAEEERLAAERRRLEEEAARKEREARELQEKKDAEARARLLAEQEALAAAARECRRLEQAWLDGRVQLEEFVATNGKAVDFKEIAGQITAFLGRDRKPCPPAPG